jgi:phosphate acyltransferase
VKKIIIGIDAMGGDFAPSEAVKGAVQLVQSNQELVPLLIGQKPAIEAELIACQVNPSDFQIVHAEEVIGMSEHPTKAISQKKNSGINIGYHLLAKGEIHAFIGAGNTGAMMVGALFSVKPIEGVMRPALTSILPKINGEFGLLVDVGANADCKPEVLNQFAVLGSLFYKTVYSANKTARVGLLNLGEEKEKGNALTLATYPLLENNDRIQFIGNVEGRDLFSDKADVVVCDGFTGNIVLKACESMYYHLMKRNIKDEYLDRFNFKHYGGTPILGVNAPVIIGHGISKADTFVKMFLLAGEVVKTNMIEKIKAAF